MSQVCTQCSRANPPEAIYCHFDGVILAGRSANGRRGAPGSLPFPSPFVFPSGKACNTFDQLAIACQENWASAVDLLQKGFLARFLGGIGRSDLAQAAQEAVRFPDADRGLDRLLARFPSRVLSTPKLRTEPTEVSLGVVPMGTNRTFELHLANLGMRLLYGSVTSDCKWLALGDAPGNPQKVFQFGGEAFVIVRICGQHLRAGNKSLEGHLLVESNGGTATVTVRADVPVLPYPNGALVGAVTPRQIAEKAQASPREAAPLFENGAVGKWFASNGWVYPVRGPAAAGVGAVQQFFEALGLAKPPKVEISQNALKLRGEVGQTVQATLELKTPEKRPVYGHAVCDQPWLDVGRTVLSGRSALLAVVVPRVPKRPGETLHASVTVTSNGNQKFRVAVSLEIGGEAPVYAEAIPVQAGADDDLPVAVAVVDEPSRPFAGPSRRRVRSAPSFTTVFVRAVPAVMLVLLVLAVLARDVWLTSRPLGPTIIDDPHPRIAVYFDEDNPQQPDKEGSMRFGLVALPRGSQPEKSLTYSKIGKTNSTVVRINGQDFVFGFPILGKSGWITKKQGNPASGGAKSAWLFESSNNPDLKIKFTQFVEVVPGEAVDLKSGNLKRYLDTCQIRYVIENTGEREAKVGLRMLVDTLIGDNDGVPFTVPGLPGLVNLSARFESPQQKIPDFLQVLEVPDLKNPGIVGFMNLKLGEGVEPPSRVLLTHWTDDQKNWEVPLRPFTDNAGQPPDSAVVLYWKEQLLKTAEKRVVGFSYGLGNLSIAAGKLGISVGGSFVPNGDLTVVALVNNPEPGQKLTLKVADGLRIVGEDQTQTVPQVPAGVQVQQSPVNWRIRADREGTFLIEVLSSTGTSQTKRITIKAKTIF